MDRQELIVRLKKLSAETGIAAAAASDRAGLGKDYVRDILRGKVQKPSAENLRILAEKGFERSAAYLLLGDEGDVDHIESHDIAHGTLPGEAEYLDYAGIVEAGNFREVDELDQREHRKVKRLPLPAYSKARQFAWEVRGDSMDLWDIREGMFVHGADYDEFVDYYRDLRDGDLVIVERAEAEGARRELTVKEALIFEDRTELHPHSSNSKWTPIIVPRGQHPTKNVSVTIIAIVLEVFKTTIR